LLALPDKWKEYQPRVEAAHYYPYVWIIFTPLKQAHMIGPDTQFRKKPEELRKLVLALAEDRLAYCLRRNFCSPSAHKDFHHAFTGRT
jgi:hypothetical protein